MLLAMQSLCASDVGTIIVEDTALPKLPARPTPAYYPHRPTAKHSDKERGHRFQNAGRIIVGVSHHGHNNLCKLRDIRREQEEKIMKQTKKLELALREADIIAAHMHEHAYILEGTREKAIARIAGKLKK